MKGVIAGVAAAAGSAFVLLAPPAAADPIGICPDNLVPVVSSLVVNGDKKDKNRNGFVCAKINTEKLLISSHSRDSTGRDGTGRKGCICLGH
jgi:hypothetical protein